MMLPLENLSITATNARKDHVADKAMIASLKSQGLLYPILVEKMDGGPGYDVVDGARRLTCIRKGIEDGELDAGVFDRIPCLVGNGDGRHLGLEQSLHANLHMSMHPLDECEAILTLSKMGEMGDDIGLRFGQDGKWVDQRVKLANLADEVKALFRDGTISLGMAMKFTLGDHARQRAFLKQHHKEGFTAHMIEPAMTDKWVSYEHVNFDLDQYDGPQERDLFGENIWLLDRKKVKELQDKWAAEEVAALEKEGYDKVEILDREDWQTLQNTVEVTGKIGKEDRARLRCFLKADLHGFITVHKNRIGRKAVDDKGKIKKKVHSADETPAENVKPMLCTELTVAQQEIVNALASSSLFAQVMEGDDLLAEYLVISNQFGGQWTEQAAALRHNGTVNRWERLNRDYPNEQLINGAEIGPWDENDPKVVTFADYLDMTHERRQELFRAAVASMIFVPYGQQTTRLKGAPELAKYDWLKPGGDFFKRYRTDQLIDYRRRSGDKEAGKTAKPKSAHVADCVVAADGPHAFKLNLYPKKIQTEPKREKKMTGGVPEA
jgi:ParB-like chromosome segregation protein Spo0J